MLHNRLLDLYIDLIAYRKVQGSRAAGKQPGWSVNKKPVAKKDCHTSWEATWKNLKSYLGR
jgi:hypothetical protein